MVLLNPLSEEQQNVIDLVKSGVNVIVDACAGSGKSTTVLSIAVSNPSELILQTTYNSSLRMEIKEKTKCLNLSNIIIHTYHSIAVQYYLSNCYTDAGIRHILYNDLLPNKSIPLFNKIVIDEAQDMSTDYYRFIKKLIKDICVAGHKVQLVILGDFMQGLYEFKGSDIRFLTLADKIWSDNPHLRTNVFRKCSMKMSYRITNQMCSFVNEVLLDENKIEACREGEPVVYIRNSRHFIEKTVIYKISQLLDSGILPSDIFILGASVKGINSNMRKLENVLVNKGIPCHIPMLENDKIDERVIQGKIVFSTFHCVKGRQRKHVFVVGFDNSYFDIYARNLQRNICPNTMYVACTRATDGLYLLENDQFPTDRPLEFLKMTHHEMCKKDYISFKGQPRSIFFVANPEKSSTLQEKHYITPTDLIKFIPDSVMEKITPIIDRIFIQNSNVLTDIEMPSIIKTKLGFFEEISDINGIALQSIYYDNIENFHKKDTKSNVLYDMIIKQCAFINEKRHPFLYEIIHNLTPEINNYNDYVYLSNVLIATQEKLYFKLKQIQKDEHNWLTEEVINECKTRLNDIIGIEINGSMPFIEQVIIDANNDNDHRNTDMFFRKNFGTHKYFRFTARTDIITETTLWELKCTSKLTIEHQLQLIIYAWIWKMTRENQEKNFKLFNVKNGELFTLNATMDELNTIVLSLINGRYSQTTIITDDEFIHRTLL